MPTRLLLLALLGLLFYVPLNGQFYQLTGKVSNASMEPMAYVNVSVVEDKTIGTTTNLKGEYTINLRTGSYIIVYSFVGYKSIKIPVIINNKGMVQNAIMEPENREIKGVIIKGKRIDRSEEIIKKVIANKYIYGNSVPYTVNAYIKAKQQESTTKKKKDTTVFSENLNLAEIYMTLNYSPPQKIKEERTGVDIRGDKDGLFFLTHTDGEFNWYKNLVEVPALSASPFLSPISNSGLFAYKYKMLESFYVGDYKYYRIKVTPGVLGNALVSGELIIMDSFWCVASVQLKLPKYHLVEYDMFEINQTYTLKDSNYFLEKQEFNYVAKYGRAKTSGRTVVYYSNYKFKPAFKKKFFNNELSSTAQLAYERDSNFWTQIRKEPFTAEEIQFIRKSDSTKALHSQKKWQDSVDIVYNKITLKKLFLTGQGNYKRSIERYWGFKPLIFAYTPIYIAGPRINYWVSYNKTFKNKKTLDVFTRANYGLYNEDLKGTVSVGRLYNPFNRGYWSASAGSDFGIINPNDAWIAIFRRSNFYVQDGATLAHRIELVNGLYLGNDVEFTNRRSIANYKFDKSADSGSLYGLNEAIDFDYYLALYAGVTLSYVPFQKYIREPNQKLILGSRWPELSVRYRKGINALGSTINFDYLEFSADQEFKVGLAGISRYRIVSGEFLSNQDLRLIDYKFQRRAGPIFFTNPLFSFQGIDSTYSTIKRFYEVHYFHRFNGALLNKIPLIKKLNLIECVGGGLLYTKERNMKYAEVFVGLEKVVKVWKERFKIGFFYVMAASNQYSYTPQFKFTIEGYDARTNKFSY
jgi:hypothetical protein